MNAPTAETILDTQHLSMRFGGLVAVDDLSFAARRGEITAIIGPNGAGKTTVFNCITGFYQPSEGMIRIVHADGKEFLLERLPDFRIAARARVARTFQNIRLFAGMTALENLLVAQHNRLMVASGFTLLGIFGWPGYVRAQQAAIEKARFWLDRVGLSNRADDPAGALPYGAQRRLEIARAMCSDPVLLCLDEPAAGLNPREASELNKLLGTIRAESEASILLIEHHMGVVMEISDHVVVLDYGQQDRRRSAARNPRRPEGDRGLSRRRRRGSGPMSAPLLSVQGVKTFYGHIPALNGVDLEVRAGEIVGLIGANGAGKSTLMMTICGNPQRERRPHRLRRPRHYEPSDARDYRLAHRAGAGRPPHLPAHDGLRKPADGRRSQCLRPLRRRHCARLQALSHPGKKKRAARRHIVRRRAADAGDRARA